MKKILFMTLAAFLPIGCQQHEKNVNGAQSSPSANAIESTNADHPDSIIKDEGTVIDQSGDEVDRTITKNIRQLLMGEDGLSKNAKNVEIITVNRIVTLRGPVSNTHEKEIIERKASKVKGVERIDNRIEVSKINKPAF